MIGRTTPACTHGHAQLTGAIAWREAQVLVLDGEEPVGLLGVENEVDGREIFLDAYALGHHRRAVLDELLARGLDRARGLAAADSEAAVPDGVDLLEGWPSTPTPAPPGVTLRVVDGEVDQRTLFRLRNESFSEHFGEAYVRTLGVIPAARGRGIARWLLQRAASDTLERRLTGLALTVDGQNTTGATRLYESVGFRTRQQIDLFCLPLTDSAHSR